MDSADFSNGLAIKSTRFLMRFAGFWIHHDARSKQVMDVARIYSICAILVAWVITGSDLWYSRRNFHQAAYAACNAMTVLIILLKLFVFSIKREAFMDLIKFCHANFWQRSYDEFGESVLRDCETRCVYFAGTFTFFSQCTVCSYAIHPIIANVGKNETDRILPFNIWLDFPITTTPYYEMMFTIEILALIHSGICYVSFDNLLCIMNVHATGQFRILQKRFESMCNVTKFNKSADSCRKTSSNIDYDAFSIDPLNVQAQYDEFKSCVRDHQSLIRFTEMVEDVYSFALLGQVVIFSLLICLVSYQAVLAEGSFSSRIIFIVHCSGTFSLLFMLTLTCDNLISESRAVADAAFRAKWYYTDSNPIRRQLSKDLVLVIARSSRPCCLTAGGFCNVSLEIFTTIINTSMSYLTLLRQGQESSDK